MHLTPEHIAHIRQQFAAMSTKHDFVELLNYAKKIVVGPDAVPFELKQITYYANPKVSGRRYRKFEIRKKSGGVRTIHSPVKDLSRIQRCLNFILQCVFVANDAATGFVPGKSIVDNAKSHIGRNYVYNIDLKDFFPSIDQARVWRCLQLPPFNLKEEKVSTMSLDNLFDLSEIIFILMYQKIQHETEEFPKEWYKILVDFHKESNRAGKLKILNELREIFIKIANNQEGTVKYSLRSLVTHWWNELTVGRLQIANMITAICCTEMHVERMDADGQWQVVKKNVIPQGAATSPVITNIICQRLDFILTGVAKRFGLKYSRYADDITFSSKHNVYQPDSEFINELRRVIADQGFFIKESKVRLQKSEYRQEVTGLVVNKSVNVHSRYVKQLRMWLYNWETYGYDRAYSYFLSSYINSRTRPLKGKPDMANVIAGKLDYLKMVRGNENEMYLKLRERYNKLINVPTLAVAEAESHFDIVLKALINEGLKKAMQIYQPKT